MDDNVTNLPGIPVFPQLIVLLFQVRNCQFVNELKLHFPYDFRHVLPGNIYVVYCSIPYLVYLKFTVNRSYFIQIETFRPCLDVTFFLKKRPVIV